MRVTLRDYSFLVNKWPPFLFLQLTQQHCGILLYSYPTEPNHMASLQFVYVVYAHFLSCAGTVPFGFDSDRCPICRFFRFSKNFLLQPPVKFSRWIDPEVLCKCSKFRKLWSLNADERYGWMTWYTEFGDVSVLANRSQQLLGIFRWNLAVM